MNEMYLSVKNEKFTTLDTGDHDHAKILGGDSAPCERKNSPVFPLGTAFFFKTADAFKGVFGFH